MDATPALPRRPLARTDLALSILGFGGVQVGDYFVRISEREAADAIDRSWNAGIRYFDTAPQYGSGLSEHRLGTWLRRRPRNEFVLSTKVGRLASPDPALDADPDHRGLPFRLRPDYTYDGTMRALEGSIHRLGLSRIDIVYIHDLEPRTYGDAYLAHFREAVEGCYRALDELRSQGVISAIGGGINEAEASVNLMRAVNLDCLLLAGRYTLLEQQTLDDVLKLAVDQGVGIVIGAPFNSGVLATGATAAARYNNRPLEPAVRAQVQGLEEICRRHSVPLPAAAMQFVLAHPATVSVVTGIGDAEEASRNRDLIMRDIPSDLWAELREAGLLRADAPVPP